MIPSLPPCNNPHSSEYASLTSHCTTLTSFSLYLAGSAMVQPLAHRAYPGSFLLRSRPKHLAIIIIFLTFISMSALLLRSNSFSDSYFGVHEKLKEESTPAYTPHRTRPAWIYPTPSPSTSKPKPHPIESLVEQGKARFKEVTSRQSKSLAEAIQEYQRRYKRTVRLANTVFCGSLLTYLLL